MSIGPNLNMTQWAEETQHNVELPPFGHRAQGTGPKGSGLFVSTLESFL